MSELRNDVPAGSDAINYGAPEPKIMPVTAGDRSISAGCESTERDRAEELISRLDGREQDILGLMTLGMNNSEIADEVHYSEFTLKQHFVPAIFAKLEISEPAGARKRAVAMQVAWSGGLLTSAQEAEAAGDDKLVATRKAIAANRIKDDDVMLMERYRLTIDHIRLAKLIAQGLGYPQIAERWSLSRRTINERAKQVEIQSGSSDDMSDLVAILAKRKTLAEVKNKKDTFEVVSPIDIESKKTLDKLTAKQKDMLGLTTLGVNFTSISRKFKLSHPTIPAYMTSIYTALGIGKPEIGSTRQEVARQIVWSAGLLIDALTSDDPEMLPHTRQELTDNGYDRYAAEIMSVHGLTMAQLKLLSYKAERLSLVQICQRAGVTESGLSKRFRQINKKLGSQEAMHRLVKVIAGRAGNTALSTEAIRE